MRPLLATGTGYAARTTRAPSPSSPGGRTRRMTCHPTARALPVDRASGSRRARNRACCRARGLGTHRDWVHLEQDKGEYGTITQVPDGRTPYVGPDALRDGRETRRPSGRAFGDDLSAADKATLGTRHRRARRDLGGGAVCRRIRLSHTATLGWSLAKSRGLLAHRDRRRAGEGGAEQQGTLPGGPTGAKDCHGREPAPAWTAASSGSRPMTWAPRSHGCSTRANR